MAAEVGATAGTTATAVAAPRPRRRLRAWIDRTAPGDRVFLPVERFIYRVCGIDETREQRWSTYALSLLAFSLVSVLVLYAQQRLQGILPLNPNQLQGRLARAVVQHRGQLPDQHQLAELLAASRP